MKEHVPHRGPHCQWVYLSSDKVLEECGMHTIQHYIDVQQQTIARIAISLLNVERRTKGAVRCPDNGGGSRGCAWRTFDAIGSCN
jgi:hypothetical protein